MRRTTIHYPHVDGIGIDSTIATVGRGRLNGIALAWSNLIASSFQNPIVRQCCNDVSRLDLESATSRTPRPTVVAGDCGIASGKYVFTIFVLTKMNRCRFAALSSAPLARRVFQIKIYTSRRGSASVVWRTLHRIHGFAPRSRSATPRARHVEHEHHFFGSTSNSATWISSALAMLHRVVTIGFRSPRSILAIAS